MPRSSPDDVIVQLIGKHFFYADERWRDQIVGSKTCPHCRWVYAGGRAIDATVQNPRTKVDLSVLSPFVAGVRIFSTRFIDVVGAKAVERVARLGHITDVRGFAHAHHRTAVARRETAVVRASHARGAGLCRKCGRLLHAGGFDQYVLRAQLPPDPFFISHGRVFCTNDFWRRHIYDAGLNSVTALEYPILDQPQDGLPATTKALKARLRAIRQFK